MTISCSALANKTATLVAFKSLSSSPRTGMCMSLMTRCLSCKLTTSTRSAQYAGRLNWTFWPKWSPYPITVVVQQKREGWEYASLCSLSTQVLGLFSANAGSRVDLAFDEHRGQPHHLPCSKCEQQGNGFETVRFAVTMHPSIGRVFQRHPACKRAAICDDICVVAPLQEALTLEAELKLIFKA